MAARRRAGAARDGLSDVARSAAAERRGRRSANRRCTGQRRRDRVSRAASSTPPRGGVPAAAAHRAGGTPGGSSRPCPSTRSIRSPCRRRRCRRASRRRSGSSRPPSPIVGVGRPGRSRATGAGPFAAAARPGAADAGRCRPGRHRSSSGARVHRGARSPGRPVDAIPRRFTGAPDVHRVAGRAAATADGVASPRRDGDPEPGEVERRGRGLAAGSSPARRRPRPRHGPLRIDRRSAQIGPPGSAPSACSRRGRAGSDRQGRAGTRVTSCDRRPRRDGGARHLAATAPGETTFPFTRGGTTFLGATPERLARLDGRSFETAADRRLRPARAACGRTDARTPRRSSRARRTARSTRSSSRRSGPTSRRSSRRYQVADAPGILALRHLQHLVTPITGTTATRPGCSPRRGSCTRRRPSAAGAARPGARTRRARGIRSRLVRRARRLAGAEGDGELMVASASALAGAQATLFAGCGIVADSDPDREWEESRLKLRTMLGARGSTGGPSP